MIETFKRVIANQFEAALCALGYCVDSCPDSLWNCRVAKYPFCQVAFHTLIFADLYLGPDPDSLRLQPYHLAHPEFFGDYEQLEDREPVSLYQKPPIQDYVKFCRQKAVATITGETNESLCAPAKFPRKNISRAELHVNNVRHIAHHAAQLSLRLRLDSDIDVPWFTSGCAGYSPLE